MNYLSLFSGIGGFDMGLDMAGLKCIGQVEKDRQASSVLAKHWPNVPRHDDVRTFNGPVRPDLICGGFPCQDLSVAGRRAGLAGERSGLFFEFMRIVGELAPAWVLIENVPGLLSSDGGRDMGTVVGRLADLGYGVAWRVLDAQWFGLAQQRRRVFVVGCAGADVRRAAEVLFERESLPWDSPPSRQAGARAARCLANGTGSSGQRYDGDTETFVASSIVSNGDAHSGFRDERGIVNCLDAHMGMGGADDNAAQAGHLIAHALTSEGHDASEDGTGRGTPIVPVAYQCHGSNVGPMGALRRGNGDVTGGVPFTFDERNVTSAANRTTVRPDGPCGTLHEKAQAVAFAIQERAVSENAANGPQGKGWQEERAFTMEARHHSQATASKGGVRRLTPVECCRLQGFPDDWLDGLELSDSAKYRMLGNAVAVPVAEWIGKRLIGVTP